MEIERLSTICSHPVVAVLGKEVDPFMVGLDLGI